jgi:DNA-directed RNA polymerase I, II, and III subunit RPABC5
MLIPIRCFTCGKTIADKWEYYNIEVKKIEKQVEEENKNLTSEEEGSLKYFDKIRSGKILDKLGLTRYCCRRHMLGQVDMMHII